MTDEDSDDQINEMNRLARMQAGGTVDPESMDDDLGEENQDDRPPAAVPWIELPRDGRPVSIFAREMAVICRATGEFFRRDSVPVTINREDGRIEPIDPVAFRTDADEFCVPFKWKSRQDEDGEREKFKSQCSMSKEVALATIKSSRFRYEQPRLEKVNMVPQPVLRRDGSIVLLPTGYDAESGIYTKASDVAIRTGKNAMSKDEAFYTLLDLHREFDFAGWNKDRTEARDLAAHIAAMVSFYASSLISPEDSRLGALYNANSHRSGKTLLFKLVVIPVEGRARVRGMPKNDEEFRKMLDAAALGARSYIILDDVKGGFQNNDLNAFMTSAYYSGRLMHSQIDYTVPNRSMVFITGHNLAVESDMAGRLLQAKLILEEADVRQKHVRRVIDDKWLAKPNVRSEILSALWGLIAAWDKDGRPKGKTMMGGFQEWCATFGGIVCHAGFGDPCARPAEEDDSDSEFDDMRTLIEEMVKEIDAEEGAKMAEFTFDRMIEMCVENSCFTWMIKGKWKQPKDEPRYFDSDPDTNARMGKLWASKYGGRNFTLKDGRRVQFGKRGKNRQRRYQATLL